MLRSWWALSKPHRQDIGDLKGSQDKMSWEHGYAICQHTANHYNIKTQNLPAERHRRFESCLGYNMPQYASGLSGLVKMLTASNPECSRYCRFVGTQFESGRDYGEHGIWRYRLTVRTWAFEACNSGSNPGNAL